MTDTLKVGWVYKDKVNDNKHEEDDKEFTITNNVFTLNEQNTITLLIKFLNIESYWMKDDVVEKFLTSYRRSDEKWMQVGRNSTNFHLVLLIKKEIK